MSTHAALRTFTEADAGCYLDSHRGHYIGRDMIELAVEFGFIIGPLARWALDTYADHSHEENYPHETLIELADSALDWLNGGPNEGIDRPTKGQNSPPIIPDDYAWAWWDGDFGLYAIEELSD